MKNICKAFPGVQAFVSEDGSAVWVSTAAEGNAVAPIHVAFQAADNDAVKAFYAGHSLRSLTIFFARAASIFSETTSAPPKSW